MLGVEGYYQGFINTQIPAFHHLPAIIIQLCEASTDKKQAMAL
jgi:hypothetical protein